MPCLHRAVLIITRTVEGTSTSVARERKNLCCGLPKGHEGKHCDDQYDERWDHDGQTLTHILRHEDEPD